jgi:hypothetical protein
MIYKYIKATIAFFMLAGATSSALFGKSPETLNEMEVRGSNKFEDLDLSRSSVLSGNFIENNNIDSIADLSAIFTLIHTAFSHTEMLSPSGE